jgi:hypothetical protein
MNAKETAEKLVADYERYLPDGDWDIKELAKTISLICVHEIISSHKSVRIATEIAARDVSMIDFWLLVKKEIDNI